MYYDVCRQWFEALSEDDKETCRTLAHMITGPHMAAAESIAASLPPAPRCPL
jgi:hypothetical protein